jgi:hypothetical protein
MGMIFGRVAGSTLTLFASFLISIALLVGIGLSSPATLNWMLDGAEIVEDLLTHTGLPDRYNNWVRIFVGDEQVLLIFFTIISRLLIAIVGSSFSAAIGRNS